MSAVASGDFIVVSVGCSPRNMNPVVGEQNRGGWWLDSIYYSWPFDVEQQNGRWTVLVGWRDETE